MPPVQKSRRSILMEKVARAELLPVPPHSDGVTATLHEQPEAEEKGSQPDLNECLAQVDMLISSSHLHGSESLCKLLQYLAHHTLHSPAVHLKEYQIATEVFGRPAGFNPQSDASVRVQVGRLRNKLADYYSSTGGKDRILVDVPKGRYMLWFERRPVAAEMKPLESARAPALLEMPAPVAQRTPWWRRPFAAALVAAVLLLAIGIGFRLVLRRASGSEERASNALAPTALKTFWNPFLHGPDKPFVIYSNAVFVGSATTSMHYFRPGKDASQPVSQLYTGVGEVMGVVQLDQLLRGFGSRPHIKRSGLFTLDDARNNNLIFVGSPMENLTLVQLPGTHEFEFRWQAGKPHDAEEEVVVDRHPSPGETGVYSPTPQTQSRRTDYAVVTLTHGLERSRWTLILAGASTIGTQAAVDYVSDERSAQQLLSRLQIRAGRQMKPFEALLQVKIVNDVPLGTKLLALRETQ